MSTAIHEIHFPGFVFCEPPLAAVVPRSLHGHCGQLGCLLMPQTMGDNLAELSKCHHIIYIKSC